MAFVCGVVSFQWRTRRSILLWLFGTAMANSCHFFILDMTTPRILFLIIGARCLAAAFSVDRRIMYVFIGLILVGFLYSYESPVGFLCLVGTLSATYGSFQRTEPRVRVFHMLSNVSWMVHNILVWTPVAAAMEATFFFQQPTWVLAFPPRGHSCAKAGPGLTSERTGWQVLAPDGEDGEVSRPGVECPIDLGNLERAEQAPGGVIEGVIVPLH